MQPTYNYAYLYHLRNDDQDNLEIRKVFVCAYTIDNLDSVPFLKYLFVRDPEDPNMLVLASYEHFASGINCKELKMDASMSLINILDRSNMGDFVFKGYDVRDTNVYVFFELTLNNNDVKPHTDAINFCLIDEIVNTRKCFNYTICEAVVAYFQSKPRLVYLCDKYGNKIENPIAGYIHADYNDLSFLNTFGVKKSDDLSLFGPYYYFTDYENAICKTNCCRDHAHSVVRFALFMGSMLVKLNYPMDPIDVSDIKTDRLEDELFERKYECLTMRISDHGGKWAENYDSVFAGRVELDDGSFLRDSPFIVIKKHKQHFVIDHNLV
jgi:hypothetical protein